MPCGECKWSEDDGYGLLDCNFPMPLAVSEQMTMWPEEGADCPQFTPRAQEEK